jgi:hypothetical protein
MVTVVEQVRNEYAAPTTARTGAPTDEPTGPLSAAPTKSILVDGDGVSGATATTTSFVAASIAVLATAMSMV